MGADIARATLSCKYGRRKVYQVSWTCGVVFPLVQRASELWKFASGQVHPEVCLTQNWLTFVYGREQVASKNRSTATALQVHCPVSKNYQNRAGCAITQARLANKRETGDPSIAAFEMSRLHLLNAHPQLPGRAPMTGVIGARLSIVKCSLQS